MRSLTDKIVLEQNVDSFITKENAKIEATQTYYKKIIVNQKEFDKIIGENGEILLYSGTTPRQPSAAAGSPTSPIRSTRSLMISVIAACWEATARPDMSG